MATSINRFDTVREDIAKTDAGEWSVGIDAAVSSPRPAVPPQSGTPLNSTPLPAGGEFRVNTHTSDTQQQGSVTALDDGGFVVTWNSFNQDGSGWGIYAQRYDGSGAPQGGEFRVSTRTFSDQLFTSIDTLADGGFLITWSSFGQDGDSWGVYGQRYDQNGIAQGGEFQINTTTADQQRFSSVSALADGGFVITWSSLNQDGSQWGVYAQRYDQDGVAQGGEFRVNSRTLDTQLFSSSAALADGGFLITWRSDNQDGSSNGTFAQRYDATGVPQGGEFQVNTFTANGQLYSSATALADGGFVITWQSSGQDGSGAGIYGQRYDAAGAPLGNEFRINTETTGNQENSSVTALFDGGFMVTWSSFGQDGSDFGVYGQRFDSGGVAIGDEFLINQTTIGRQRQERFQLENVVKLADGSIVAVWDGNGPGDTNGIFARILDVPGNTPPLQAVEQTHLDLRPFITIEDADNPAQAELVVSVESGILSYGGSLFASLSGNGTNTVTFTGSLEDINRMLDPAGSNSCPSSDNLRQLVV